ncbi:MAG: DEAD/DEAH box helicase, partial [Chitinophagia bacterium]|nr:DEAD/DEAH box helicase [Chitinophagia bacterium]
TYGVPVEMQDAISPGMRVEVSLGKNKQYSGIVERLHNERPETYQVKPVKSLIDQMPVVTLMQLQFWIWIADYYLAAPGEVMQAALPAHLKLSAETRLQWIASNNADLHWSNDAWPAVDALVLRGELTMTELRAVVPARSFATVLNELIENEAVNINDTLDETYKPRKEKIVTLAPAHKAESAMEALFGQLQKAPKQLDVLMGFLEIGYKKGFVPQAELLERTGATAAQVNALADKGIFIIEEREISRLAPVQAEALRNVQFTEAQQTAYNSLQQALGEGKVTLLHGVTGSGKTLLYIRKIRECIAAGSQALFLLPEIGLTTHLVGRLIAYFGDELGVYHSHFSNNERVEIWEKVRKGAYKVVVGPRSALWLPYSKLGLVVVDEEHDPSYKQRDPAPRFHARDAAIYLAAQ